MSTHASNPGSSVPSETPFGVADLLRVVSGRRDLIRNIALAVVALTVVVTMMMPTLYTTSAVVMLDQRKNNVADTSSVLSALPTDASSVQNQIQVLSSRDLALKVIDRLQLYADPEFNPALGRSDLPDLNPLHYLRSGQDRGDPRDAVVNAFLNRLSVSALGLSTSIEVSFTAKEPGKAALIANTLAKSYTDDQIATKQQAARQAAGWLSDRMRQLSQQVQQQEAAVQLYKSEHDLVESADGKSLVDEQLVAINAQLIQAQSDLAEKRAAYERVVALAKSGNAAEVTPVVNSKMIGDLRTQEAEVVRQEADLATRYGPNHPKMVAIRNQKRDLASKIASEVAGIAGSMQSELEVARAHVGAIEASLQRVERQAREDNMARIKLKALEANLASTRTAYESFVSRLRAVQDQDDIQMAEARVISTAPVPAAPSSPHRSLLVGASIPVGLLLGILVALVLERFEVPAPQAARPVLRSAAPLTAPMPSPAAAAAPRRSEVPRPSPQMPPLLAELATSADPRMADWLIDNPGSRQSQQIVALLSRLVPARTGQARIIAVTAPASDAGKSVAVHGLARVAALQGLRTVVIDADRGCIAPGGPANGIAALLAGAPLPAVLVRDRRTSAFLLSSMPDVWPTTRTADLFRHLRQTCDLVLIDAAPPGTAGVWPALGRLADGVVVFAAASAPQTMLEGALRSLVAMSSTVSGLVVTR